jgi:hypothetical protein
MSENTGIIYKLDSPEGKSYIGQHNTNDPDVRMRTHVNGYNAYAAKLTELSNMDENDPNRENLIKETRKGCIALYRAFAKYGPEKFEYEVLFENIPLDELNDLEDKCILQYDTLAPNGYNLRLNGKYANGRTLSEESRKRFSDAAVLKNKKYLDKYRRYKTEMKYMPQYITFYNDKEGYRGYKISKHPKCYSKSFTSKTIPLDTLKANCLEFLDSLETKYVKDERKLPIGICKPKNRNGYMAYFKVNKVKYSSYHNGYENDEDNLQSAVEWLEEKKSEILNTE